MDPVFRAIADPSRREMLVRLTAGPLDAGALGAGFSMSQPAVSQHLKVLRDAGLVEDERIGRRRQYRLRADGLRAVHAWTQTFERFWSGRFDLLEALLDELPEDNDHG